MSYRFSALPGQGVCWLVFFAAFALVAATGATGLAQPAQAPPAAKNDSPTCNYPAPYTSPYTLTYTCDTASLSVGFDQPPRNDTTLESTMPYADWYDQAAYNQGDITWGPPPAQYPAVSVPANAGCSPLQWKRERIVATAAQYIGRFYQHHHIPDWDPPADWPYSETLLGCQTPGIDCSDFSSWYYNYGLGIKLNTAVAVQALPTTPIPGPGGVGNITPKVVAASVDNVPPDFATLCGQLQTGDLLYIKGSPTGPVTHVILWVGSLGSGPDPLVLDSHDNSPVVHDSDNVAIPLGVHLRPFRVTEWYYTSFSHALRILASGESVPPANGLLLGDQ